MGTTSTETVTRTELVDLALRQLGVVNPNDTERTNAILVLNAMLKELDPSADWRWTWVLTPGSISTVANQRAYDVATDGLASNIYRIEIVEKVTGTTLDPITIIDTPAALTNVDREGTGEPQWAYLERAPVLAHQKLHLFPTPDAVYTYQYTYRRRIYDFTASTDNPDFPGEWNYALAIMLANKMAREYNMPIDFRQDLRIEAQELEFRMRAANSETEYKPTIKTLYY